MQGRPGRRGIARPAQAPDEGPGRGRLGRPSRTSVSDPLRRAGGSALSKTIPARAPAEAAKGSDQDVQAANLASDHPDRRIPDGRRGPRSDLVAEPLASARRPERRGQSRRSATSISNLIRSGLISRSHSSSSELMRTDDHENLLILSHRFAFHKRSVSSSGLQMYRRLMGVPSAPVSYVHRRV